MALKMLSRDGQYFSLCEKSPPSKPLTKFSRHDSGNYAELSQTVPFVRRDISKTSVDSDVVVPVDKIEKIQLQFV